MKNLKVGDRVVVPFPIACGSCSMCQSQMYSLCENSNPNAWMAEKMLRTCGRAGSSATRTCSGGFAGGQAEYARVPFADVGPLKIPDGIPDEKVLFLSDIFPTGYMGAEMCDIKQGDVIAVWGCGPVGQFAIESAYLLGAERVIAHRSLRVPAADGAREGWRRDDQLREPKTCTRRSWSMTGGRGPDACIDAVGMEAHGAGAAGVYDRVKQAMMAGIRPAASPCARRSWPAATAARSR